MASSDFERELAPVVRDDTPDGYTRFDPGKRPGKPGTWLRFPDKRVGVWCPECGRGQHLLRLETMTKLGLNRRKYPCERCGLVIIPHLVGWADIWATYR